jgi:hypothetical protein
MRRYIAIFLALVCILGLIGCGQQKQLTLDKVIELSSKRDDLTWKDFEQYKGVITGSGLYILVYDIDNIFELWIGGGVNSEEPPTYIRLVTKANRDNYIDIRTDDVKEFIEANKK